MKGILLFFDDSDDGDSGSIFIIIIVITVLLFGGMFLDRCSRLDNWGIKYAKSKVTVGVSETIEVECTSKKGRIHFVAHPEHLYDEYIDVRGRFVGENGENGYKYILTITGLKPTIKVNKKGEEEVFDIWINAYPNALSTEESDAYGGWDQLQVIVASDK